MGGMTVRRLVDDPAAAVSRHWLGGDALRTHVFNALSMLFPAGEQNFIDVVREFAAEVQRDPALAAAVREFIAQEAIHQHTHKRFNARLTELGYRNIVEPWVKYRIAFSQRYNRLSRLAVVAAYEHFTAMLGDGLLRHPVWIDGAPPALRTLWGWHAVEETEHKAVSFDVYAACGGGYGRRVAWYLYASLALAFDVTAQTVHMLWRDRALFSATTLKSAARLMVGREGVLWHMLPQWAAYLRPEFHPNQMDNQALLDDWLAHHADAWRPVGTHGGEPA